MAKDKKQYLKDYYEKNKERLQTYNRNRRKDWYDENKDSAIEYQKEYNKANSDKVKAYNKQWVKDNPEKVKSYTKKDKEYFRDYNKMKCATDPLFKLTKNIRALIRYSIKSKGYVKNSKTFEILGCNYEEFKTYIESKFEDWMTWDNYGVYEKGKYNVGWDIDHIIPSCSALTESDIIGLNHYTNLQPLCSKVNRDIKRDLIG